MRTLRLVLLLVLSVALAGGTAYAQRETGRISGVVTDPQGGVVPGVSVTATAVASGVARSTVSDSDGNYLFANLPPTEYEVKFELSGFKTTTNRVTVSVGADIGLNPKLEVGALTEQVTVTAATEVVNIRNAEFSTNINTRQIVEMPTLTRNPYDLVALAGNVQQSPNEEDELAGEPRGVGYSINGGRSASANILLDGGDNNDQFTASVGQPIPLDSVQEFSVITNNYSAQYGRAIGGIVNLVTKSGTNRFSGTAYEFFRNEKLASNTPDNIANDIEKGKFRRNQVGYSFGGPVVKDKVHFFSSLEFIHVKSNDTLISWIPTAEFLAASNPLTRAYFSQYGQGGQINGPVLTRSQVSSIIGTGAGAFSQLPANLPIFGQAQRSVPIDAGGGDPQKDYQTVNKVNFSLGPATNAYVSYAYRHRDTEPGTQSVSPYTGYDTGVIDRNHNLNGSVTHVWSNNFTTQSKVIYNRLFEEQPVNGPPIPRLVMNTAGPIRLQGYRIAFPGYLPFNPGNDIPFGGPQNLFQIYQDQTWLKGSHDVRFGGAFVRIQDNRTFSAYSNAVQALNTSNNALISLDNFVQGQILRYQAAINPNGYPGGSFVTPVQQPSFTSFNRYNEYAFYVQDNWSIGPRLKVNLGLRYEYFGPQQKSEPKYDSNFYYGDPDLNISEAPVQQIINGLRTGSVMPSNQSPIGALWAADKNNFAPRVGFAWDVNGDGRTSVRGGYGRSYERNFGNVTFNVLFNPPLYLVTTIDAPANVPSLPVFTDNAGPFAGSGIRRTIPAGSVRHVDQNIRTAYAHLYGVAFQKELRPAIVGGIEYNGSTGRDLYDLADINKAGAALVYTGVGGAFERPNTQYSAFNTRGNRGQSQYHGMTLSLDAQKLANTGLIVNTRYTLSRAKDNLSGTFSDADNNGFFNLGFLDAFDPMLDYGYAGFDVRHRFTMGAIWNIPYGGSNTWLGGWQMNAILTARSGYPFSVFDCTNGAFFCMRALDTANITKKVGSGTATGNPNEFQLIDLAPIAGAAGSYAHPVQGTSDFGPYPASMTERNAFRGPGYWNIDYLVGKRFRFAGTRAVLIRLELYNVFNHRNMYVRSDAADVSSATSIIGFLDDHRRAQLGFKFEF